MALLKINIGPLAFIADLLERDAPRSCTAFLELLPQRGKIIQEPWSGEAGWVSLGSINLIGQILGYENPTSRPGLGEMLLYSSSVNEVSILFPYGSTLCKNKTGLFIGNHFATITDGREELYKLSMLLQWEGAQNVFINNVSSE